MSFYLVDKWVQLISEANKVGLREDEKTNMRARGMRIKIDTTFRPTSELLSSST
jgi:hypothetical protein